jgi:HD superfamily phosphohydrolase
MEVRDPVHGSIKIQNEEIQIIEHPFFQRLRNIKQLGFSEFVFPGATHTRYIHSIGVMDVSSKVLKINEVMLIL